MADVLSAIAGVKRLMSAPPCHDNSTLARAIWAAAGEDEATKQAVFRSLRRAIPVDADVHDGFPVIDYQLTYPERFGALCDAAIGAGGHRG